MTTPAGVVSTSTSPRSELTCVRLHYYIAAPRRWVYWWPSGSHPLEDSSVTMDCSCGPALSSNTAASFSAPQLAALCGGTPALSICINYGRLSTTSAIVSFSIVVKYYHMKKPSYQKCIKINISCIISKVSEIRLTAFQSGRCNYTTKDKQNKSYIQADLFFPEKCKFTDDRRKSVVLFFSM